MLRSIKLPDLSIPSAGTTSIALPAKSFFSAVSVISFYGPAALTGTVTLEVSADGLSFVPLEVDGANVTLPAGKCVYVVNAGYHSIRLSSTAAEGATRTYKLRGVESYGL